MSSAHVGPSWTQHCTWISQIGLRRNLACAQIPCPKENNKGYTRISRTASTFMSMFYLTPSWTSAFQECSSFFTNLRNNAEPGLLKTVQTDDNQFWLCLPFVLQFPEYLGEFHSLISILHLHRFHFPLARAGCSSITLMSLTYKTAGCQWCRYKPAASRPLSFVLEYHQFCSTNPIDFRWKDFLWGIRNREASQTWCRMALTNAVTHLSSVSVEPAPASASIASIAVLYRDFWPCGLLWSAAPATADSLFTCSRQAWSRLWIPTRRL